MTGAKPNRRMTGKFLKVLSRALETPSFFAQVDFMIIRDREPETRGKSNQTLPLYRLFFAL